jgi:uncharacterized protein (DUF983 family)
MGEPSSAVPNAAPPSRALIVRRALARLCPRCGRGALFARYARLHAACPSCGLVYRRESGAQTGSMYVIATATELFTAALVIAVFTLTDWSPWTSIALCLPLVLGFCYACLPWSISAWVAVEYATDRHNRESWV